jgi:hypothetical protein
MDINRLRIGVIVPHRNDRPLFLEHLRMMLSLQTIQPKNIYWIDYAPESNEKDITQRYKVGYKRASAELISNDILAFIECDDYYAPDYLETMVHEWLRAGQPDIIGTGRTIYYHLKLKKYFTLTHPRRASAMNTLIKPNLSFPWCEDNYAFTDLHLWNLTVETPLQKPILKGHIFNPEKIISIGMKHGVGLTGGRCHIDRLQRYNVDDSESNFLKEHCDKESFEFYSNYFK